jgi:hypothetical protein
VNSGAKHENAAAGAKAPEEAPVNGNGHRGLLLLDISLDLI